MAIVTLDLPDTLAAEANAAGLLLPEALEQMLRDSLRRKAMDGLFSAAEKLADAGFPTMTMDEIQAEVSAVRAQRKHRAAGA